MAKLVRAGVLAATGLALLLAGCARPVGDVGRAAPDALHDQIMPAIGDFRATQAKEPVSSFNLTDEEQQMRDRIWRYLVDPHAYDWFGGTVVELERTRIEPISTRPLRKDQYYLWLHGQTFASSHVRYSRLADDIDTDIATMPAAFISICAALNIDRQRGIASNGEPQLEDSMRQDAAARHAENEAVIGWFVRAVRNRYDSYGYALDHLLVETPHEDAVGVNGSLSQMATYVEGAERGDFCDVSISAGGRTIADIPSRILRSQSNKGS